MDDDALVDIAKKDALLNNDSVFDELDVDLPVAGGEFVVNSSKIQEINHENNKLLCQLDILNIITGKLTAEKRSGEVFGSHVFQSSLIEGTKEQLKQEIGEIAKQRAKLLSQEMRDAILPGQCQVTIEEESDEGRMLQNTASGDKRRQMYILKIERIQDLSGWVVRRTYNDFYALHRKLRDKYPIVNEFDLPGKSLNIWPNRTKGDTGNMKQQALEKYLQVKE
jgi:sorting nexin-25